MLQQLSLVKRDGPVWKQGLNHKKPGASPVSYFMNQRSCGIRRSYKLFSSWNDPVEKERATPGARRPQSGHESPHRLVCFDAWRFDVRASRTTAETAALPKNELHRSVSGRVHGLSPCVALKVSS
jgi:hypothetical protein